MPKLKDCDLEGSARDPKDTDPVADEMRKNTGEARAKRNKELRQARRRILRNRLMRA